MKKISRAECFLRYPVLPESKYDPVLDEDEIRFPEVAFSGVFRLPAPSFSKLAAKLGSALSRVARDLGIGELIFLGDSDLPWRYRDGHYPPDVRALAYLEALRIGKRFNGGLVVAVDELPEFIRHLVWLVRTNTVIPQVWCTDPEQRLIISPCQYGSLHHSIVDAVDEAPIQDAFRKRGFTCTTMVECSDNFGRADAIPGRTMSYEKRP